MHPHLTRILRLTQVAALLLLVGLGALLVHSLSRFEEVEQQVDQAREVIDEIQKVRLAALRSGIWLRNYAVSPSPEMLARVRSSAHEGMAAVRRLTELTQDHPEQNLQASVLSQETSDLFEAYLSAADFAEHKGVAALEPVLNSRVQVDHTRRVRERLDGMERLGRHELKAHKMLEKQHLQQVKKLLVGVALVVTALLLWSTWYSAQVLRQKREALAQAGGGSTGDPLTGLPTHREFLQQLSQLMQRVAQAPGLAAVLVFDLDAFKEVNEIHGHAAGDKVLKVVTDRLRQQCRSREDLVARLGGDEFAVALGSVNSREGVLGAAQRILAKLHAPIEVEGSEVRISVSLGIALVPEDGQDPESALQVADAGLYRAKQAGRGQVAFGAPRPN